MEMMYSGACEKSPGGESHGESHCPSYRLVMLLVVSFYLATNNLF